MLTLFTNNSYTSTDNEEELKLEAKILMIQKQKSPYKNIKLEW